MSTSGAYIRPALRAANLRLARAETTGRILRWARAGARATSRRLERRAGCFAVSVRFHDPVRPDRGQPTRARSRGSAGVSSSSCATAVAVKRQSGCKSAAGPGQPPRVRRSRRRPFVRPMRLCMLDQRHWRILKSSSHGHGEGEGAEAPSQQRNETIMRAATSRNYGTPDVLTLEDVPRPEVADGQILVAVHASVVTQGDRRLRAADFPGFTALLGRLFAGLRAPRHPVGGTNFAGRVVAVGRGVTRFAVGDDVFGSVGHGAYAEYLTVAEADPVAKLPSGLDYGEAAALPYGAVTALVFLRDVAKVQPGERVLVVGASGGVGQFAVQVARALGADVVGVARRNPEALRSLGASRVIDYSVEDVTRSDDRYDVVFDLVEGGTFRRYRRVLAPRGRYVSVYVTLRLLFEMVVSRWGDGPRAATGVAMGTAALISDIRDLVQRGALRPIVAGRYSLERIADAHASLENDKPFGSVVVEVRPSAPMAERPEPARLAG
ncbi:MAG: NAD(P)-dependent alcohol dehydrogenase [Myxococcales bacterium FL481]|nr:MAG: NAD(P)-dependent alcohol dehydrogenase [Myxococcales bacterium FL481]